MYWGITGHSPWGLLIENGEHKKVGHDIITAEEKQNEKKEEVLPGRNLLQIIKKSKAYFVVRTLPGML